MPGQVQDSALRKYLDNRHHAKNSCPSNHLVRDDFVDNLIFRVIGWTLKRKRVCKAERMSDRETPDGVHELQRNQRSVNTANILSPPCVVHSTIDSAV